MRALLFIGGGILIGVGFTHAEATVAAEKRATVKLIEEVESHKRVINMAAESFLQDQMEGPFPTEEDLDRNKIAMPDMDGPDTSADAITVGGEMTVTTSISAITPSADYLAAARDYQQPVETSTPLIPVEYITEDDYHEEDGRAKEQILIHMGGDGEPLFVNEGVMLPDWQELISPNILVDLYQRVPPGSEERVLYVRNHRNDTDYEVIQEIP